MTLHAPQIILLGLTITGFGVNLAKGEDAFTTWACPAILLALLWWGGFFG